jgi:hypothetical protein
LPLDSRSLIHLFVFFQPPARQDSKSRHFVSFPRPAFPFHFFCKHFSCAFRKSFTFSAAVRAVMLCCSPTTAGTDSPT